MYSAHHLFIDDLYDDEKVTDAIFCVIIDMGGLYLIENKCLFNLLRDFMICECIKVSRQGRAQAQNYLGECYMNCNGFSQNYEIAIELFVKAAEQGNPKSQFNLGYCYEKGYGIIANRNQARIWYEKAAEQGELHAIEALERFNTEDLPF